MSHTLDLTKLGAVFAALEADGGYHLTTWEMERLPEWKAIWERGDKLSDRQLEIIEQMYLKV